MYIKDLLSEEAKSILKKIRIAVETAADKAGNVVGFIGERITGKAAEEIDREVEKTVDEFLDNFGYCISDVNIEQLMKGIVDNAANAVGDLKLEEFIEEGYEDVYDFVDEVGDFIAEKHLPPTPCCFLISNIRDKLKKGNGRR